MEAAEAAAPVQLESGREVTVGALAGGRVLYGELKLKERDSRNSLLGAPSSQRNKEECSPCR